MQPSPGGTPPRTPRGTSGGEANVPDVLTPVLTANWDQPDSFTRAGYERTGGYQAIRKAFAMQPDEVIATVKASVLRGRGGAGFPPA